MLYVQADVARQRGLCDLGRNGVGIRIVSHIGVGTRQIDTPFLGQIAFHLLAVLLQQLPLV